MTERKRYLGDSVYADFDGWNIALTTENGTPADPSNIVYLEPSVLIALIAYAEDIGLVATRGHE